MRSRLAVPAAALLVLAACLPAGALAASPGGAAAADEPTAFQCAAPVDDAAVAQASAARSLLRITGRPHVAGRHVSVDTDVAMGGCLTLTLYPRGARKLDSSTQIGTVVRTIAAGGPTRSVVMLNARGRRLLTARRAIAAMLITDFRAAPGAAGGEVTLSTPVWL